MISLRFTGNSGSVRGSHEQQQRPGLRVRGEDRPEDVLPFGGNRTGCPRVGGRHIHRCRRVPRVSKDFADGRRNRHHRRV